MNDTMLTIRYFGLVLFPGLTLKVVKIVKDSQHQLGSNHSQFLDEFLSFDFSMNLVLLLSQDFANVESGSVIQRWSVTFLMLGMTHTCEVGYP